MIRDIHNYANQYIEVFLNIQIYINFIKEYWFFDTISKIENIKEFYRKNDGPGIICSHQYGNIDIEMEVKITI